MKRISIFKCLLCLLVLCLLVTVAEAGQKLLGDESDGSRAHPTHRINVFAEPSEQGKEAIKIDPNINPAEEVLLPFSMRQQAKTGRMSCPDLVDRDDLVYRFSAGGLIDDD